MKPNTVALFKKKSTSGNYHGSISQFASAQYRILYVLYSHMNMICCYMKLVVKIKRYTLQYARIVLTYSNSGHNYLPFENVSNQTSRFLFLNMNLLAVFSLLLSHSKYAFQY